MANTRLFVCLPAEPVTYPGVLCLCPEQTEFSRGRLSNQLKTLVLAAHFSRDDDANIFTAALPTLSDCKRAARSLSREPGRRRRRAGTSEVPGFITDTRIKSQHPNQNHHVGYCRWNKPLKRSYMQYLACYHSICTVQDNQRHVVQQEVMSHQTHACFVHPLLALWPCLLV